MDIRQKILAAVFGITLLAFIIELVRRRKLRVEYSWLWICAGLAIVVVGLNYALLEWITKLIGAGWTSSTLFFFGIFFVVTLCLQFSVKISRLETEVKNLAQELSLREPKMPKGNL
ncbi:MAG: DUF2304 domain-containing protein [Candidatus Hydrogenedentes bacterium]|nr:DUF2304 domain-containing protein [Candidatus Hydrogenedentota bacterium]